MCQIHVDSGYSYGLGVSHVCVQNVYVNISRIVAVGKRLLDGGHYAAMQIQQLSAQLEREWKAFASALDERSAMLEMSASFHQKADQVRVHGFT